MEKTGEAMQSALHHLQSYKSWLLQAKSCLEQDDQATVVAVYEEAQGVIPGLVAALDEYSKIFAATGAYATPWGNTLSRVAEGIQAGQAGDEAWDECVVGFQSSFVARVQELRNTPLPGRRGCIQAYQQAVECLSEMQHLDSLDQASVDADLRKFEAAVRSGQKLEDLMRASLEGPAAMPATNVLIGLVKKGLSGELDHETVAGVIDDYREIMDSFWEGFERSLARPVNSALVQDEVPRTLEYGDSHDAAVEDLGAAFKSGDQAGVQSALEQLLATAAQLDESREVFETAAKHQTNVLCPACGRANPPENRRCEACGNQLPVADLGASSSFSLMTGPALEDNQEMPMTENVAKIFQSCDDVASGKISADEFLEVLREAKLGLQDYAKELDEIAEETTDVAFMPEEMRQVWSEQHQPYVEEVALSITEGVKDCEQGLLEMEAYLSDSNEQHLVDGVRMVWEGLGGIHRARLSMTATLKMLDDILEEAREKGLLAEES